MDEPGSVSWINKKIEEYSQDRCCGHCSAGSAAEYGISPHGSSLLASRNHQSINHIGHFYKTKQMQTAPPPTCYLLSGHQFQAHGHPQLPSACL
ncbi:hypothetical protein SAY87_015830 [Trapa incisa]|uniref:Uncharacterized protein n=1 Tax=Trapa incisa TaxID=236973 RepID=A0AAN7L857_9MYRT|nr:hypothetical protein SAY87_015830 [Trapa incisa]